MSGEDVSTEGDNRETQSATVDNFGSNVRNAIRLFNNEDDENEDVSGAARSLLNRSIQSETNHSNLSRTNSIMSEENSSLDLDQQNPLQPYATIQDFGNGDFPDEAEEVLQDYFSHSAGEVVEVPAVPVQSERAIFSRMDNDIDYRSQQDSLQNDAFFDKPCCSLNCNLSFEKTHILSTRESAIENEITCADHVNHNHIFLLGQLSALTVNEESSLTSSRDIKQRERASVRYMFQGHQVCKPFFLFVNHCGKKRFKRLLKQFMEQGIAVSMHGNQGRSPKNATSLARVEEIRLFLTNFSNVHGLILPGRMPQVHDPKQDPDLRLLPCSFTKVFVHKVYSNNCLNPVPYVTFAQLWQKFFPNIVIQKPRTDLCPQCQKNTLSLQNLSSLSESDKLTLLETSREHLETVMNERQLYSNLTKRMSNPPLLQPSVPMSFRGTMHYSFDFAQQVFLPYDSQQVGPLYFLSPYKVALFGVACEPLGKFVLYIMPESAAGVGKGSNTVISLLHHFFENFSVGEEDLYFHADNCAGQNKNNFLLQYGVWRVQKGFHKTFKISFLPVGHTKFAPDLYFGCVKKTLRRSSVSSLEDFKNAILASCSNTIIPFVVGNEGSILDFKFYDWQAYFKKLSAKRIPGLLENYHFECSSHTPGQLKYRKSIDSDVKMVNVFSDSANFDDYPEPEAIEVPEIPLARQIYLHDKIRPYVPDVNKDRLCPAPLLSTNLNVEQEPSSSSNIAAAQSNVLSTISASVFESTNEIDADESLRVSNRSAEDASSVARTSQQSTSLIFKHPAKPSAGASASTQVKQRKASRCHYCHQEGHTNRLHKGVPVCPKRREDESEDKKGRGSEQE